MTDQDLIVILSPPLNYEKICQSFLFLCVCVLDAAPSYFPPSFLKILFFIFPLRLDQYKTPIIVWPLR